MQDWLLHDTDYDWRVEVVEIATGGYLRDVHCKPDKLLHDEGLLRNFKKLLRGKIS